MALNETVQLNTLNYYKFTAMKLAAHGRRPGDPNSPNRMLSRIAKI